MAQITVDDFIGKFNLTKTDSNTNTIEDYIERYETKALVELFGLELFNLWEAGVTANDPIYTKLQLPFIEQLDNGLILDSKGVKDYLLGVIYYYYTCDDLTRQTVNGSVRNKGENSNNVSLAVANVHSRYNEGIDTYRAIQNYICDNMDIYPDFKGIHKEILSIV